VLKYTLKIITSVASQKEKLEYIRLFNKCRGDSLTADATK